jgi:hypothetical protein
VISVAQVFFWVLAAVPAVILGHIARRQIRQTGENGAGMAVAALILCYIGIGLGVITVAAIIAFIVVVHGQGNFHISRASLNGQ